ncbi:MAG: hypothetical protein P8X42_14590 [Calditrichaceae bacterium]
MFIRKIYVFPLLLVILSCSLHEPKLPEWDTNWKIYLPTQDLIMGEEIINDSTFIAGYANDSIPIILFNLDDSTDWERVEASDLILEPQQDHFHAEVGDIELGDYDDLTSDSTYLDEILPPELFMAGDSLVPFDTITVYPPDDTLRYTEYQFATIARGKMWITFHNQTFLDVREGLTAKIYNQNGSVQYIDETYFNEPIPAGTSMPGSPIDINNKTIYNVFIIEYTIPIAAMPEGRHLSQQDLDGFFSTTLSADSLTAIEAEAQLPQQDFEEVGASSIEDQDHRVRNAEIDEGNLQITIKNTVPVDVNVSVELPDIRKDGMTKKISSKLKADRDTVITESIAGWEIINSKSPGTILDSLNYIATIVSDPVNTYTYIASHDSIGIDVETDSIRLAAVSGILDTVNFNIDEVEMDKIDVFEDFNGQVRLNELAMELIFENQIDIPINVDLTITGSRSDGEFEPVQINVSEVIQASGVSPITRITIDDDYSNPSIVDLLAILPDSIKIGGEAFVFGDGSVSVGDGLRVQYNITSPLTIDIGESLTFDSEIDSITYDDIGEDERDKIVNDLADVSVVFNFNNHVPIGGNLKYYMATDSMELYSDTITDSSRKIVIEADIGAGVKGSDGFVQNTVHSAWQDQLTDRQLDIFNYPTIYTRQEIMIHSTDGEVKIRQSDSIEIEAIMDFKITINSESD